jgi:gliotoxin/aspirochlorine biosynthesis aminotransferase
VGNGAGSIINMLAYALCESGDGIIIPSPYYSGISNCHSLTHLPNVATGFDSDLLSRAGVVPIPAFLHSSKDFEFDISKLNDEFDISKLNDAFDNATVPVKGLLLCSPNNPWALSIPKNCWIIS